MKKAKENPNPQKKNLPNKRPRTTNHYTTIHLSNIRNTNTPIFYTKQHQGNYSTQHMTEPAPMSRGSSLTGAPPTSRTGKVAWRGDRNEQEPPRNAKKPRGPSPKGTPPASRTEKSPGGGAISHLQVMDKRVSITEREEPYRIHRTAQVQRISVPFSSFLTRRGGVTWTASRASPLVTKPLRPRAVRT
jgi:hypothetical protein